MAQLATATAIPIVHTVELVDWATGGPAPHGLGAAGAKIAAARREAPM